MYQKTMKQLPKSEQPYERCLAHGAGALSDRELLTVLIRSGTRQQRADEVALQLLELCGEEGLAALCRKTAAEIQTVTGIGKVKAVQLCCLCELAARIFAGTDRIGAGFHSPEEIASHYLPRMCHLGREVLLALILDSKNRVLSEQSISVGTINYSVADPREIYSTVLRQNGSSVILLHNHPSGDPTPSREDISSTQRIFQAGKLLGISLLDHIILGKTGYVSLREEGYLNFL